MDNLPPLTRDLIDKLDETFSTEVLFPKGSETVFEIGVLVGQRKIIEYLKEKLRQADQA